jgi:hypothetical protein
MSKAAVPPTGFSATPPAPAPQAHAAPAPRTKVQPSIVKRVFSPLASLRVTVVLFALAILLVFFGTLAQIDQGIWSVVNTYFRALYVWIPLQIFFPRSLHVPGSFPFPGGWLIGGALLVNLLAAHLVRFRLSWNRSGVLVLHAGLVVMMVSEFITGHYGIEGMMTIPLKKSANYVEEQEKPELAILAPVDDKTDDVVVIPTWMLRKGGLIHHASLPFDVQVDRYMVNSEFPRDARPGEENPADKGLGEHLVAVPRREGSGVSPDQKYDLPSAYVTFKKKDSGESLGTYLVSLWFSVLDPPRPPQKVSVDGKTYEVELRFKRTYKPYTIQLLKFTHDIYPGTDIPKDFRSRVRLTDRGRNEEREVEIYMNQPLRYRGETFYQASFIPGDPRKREPDKGTILQVVRNPGWTLPYLACAMVALGMVLHFGLNLVSFLNRRVAR